MIIKTQVSPVKVKFARENPQLKRTRLEKRSKQRRTLEGLGVSTRFQLDEHEDMSFLTEKEQEAYQKDCLLATLYLKSGGEIPADLKERLLSVKAKRDAFFATREQEG